MDVVEDKILITNQTYGNKGGVFDTKAPLLLKLETFIEIQSPTSNL